MANDDLPEGFRSGDPTARPRTEHDTTEVKFALSEHADGVHFFVMFEESSPGLQILKAGAAFLALEFRDQVSFAEAQALVTEMNEKLHAVSYTSVP